MRFHAAPGAFALGLFLHSAIFAADVADPREPLPGDTTSPGIATGEPGADPLDPTAQDPGAATAQDPAPQPQPTGGADPVPIPAPPPGGTMTQGTPICTWSQVWKYDSDNDSDSNDCSGKLGSCWGISYTYSQGSYIRGRGEAFDSGPFTSAATAASSTASATLHIYRTDSQPCASKLLIQMQVSFCAIAEVDAPATGGAAGFMDILAAGAQLRATAAGAINGSSSGTPTGFSIPIGNIRVTPVLSSESKKKQHFIDSAIGLYAARVETFLMAGAVSVYASADGFLFGGPGDGVGEIDESTTTLQVNATCESPCGGSTNLNFNG